LKGGSSNQAEDELHFIINCPLYIDNREIIFNNIGELCPKLKDLPNEAKFAAHSSKNLCFNKKKIVSLYSFP
jgi:hypothetical protein